MKIIIESIRNKYLLSDREYEWLNSHLGEELPLSCIAFDSIFSSVIYLAIDTNESETGNTCLTLFGNNGAKFKFVGLEEMSCIDTI